MANVVYSWNPFQTIVNNRIIGEVIKPSGNAVRSEFLVRAAPFFSNNFKLFRQGSTVPLKLGVDYVFGHTFDAFISEYNRNAFGSVILLRSFGNDVLVADYDTIGGPFVLDEIEYIGLALNILTKPREESWESITNTPTDWPADPHQHPVTQTYDYNEMMTALRSLILAVTSANDQVEATLESAFRAHLDAELPEAHISQKADFGLEFTPNMPSGDFNDLQGNSGEVLVTVAMLKEAFRQLRDGTLIFN